MLGFFRQRAPLNLREKTWVELRMEWLIERLGIDSLRNCEVVTPTDSHFPAAYSGSDEEIERLFVRICETIGVPRDAVELMLFGGAEGLADGSGQRNATLGLYQRDGQGPRATVWIEASQATDPMLLVATIAHELSHHLLLGGGHLTGDEADHEFVTDLLPVVRGLGIFPANSAVAERTESSALASTWAISKRGYLPARMLGYALAVFAWVRGERDPDWPRYLRADARDVMQAGLKYLCKTNDCRCRNPRLGIAPAENRLYRLTGENSGVKLAALWELRCLGDGQIGTQERAAVADILDHRDPILQSEAALTIAALDLADAVIAEKCLDALAGSAEDSVLRAALALALAVQCEPSDAMIYDVTMLLDDNSERVVTAALTALRQFGPITAPVALPKITERIQRAALECNGAVLTHALAALRAVCESPKEWLAKQIKGDADLRSRALDALGMDVDDESLVTARLPTRGSLPVPLPDWSPNPTRSHTQFTPHANPG